MTSTGSWNFGRRAALACVGLLALTCAGTSRAQSNSAIAENLFREGKTLMTKGDYEHACPKFAESVRIDASSGSALALGVCLAAQGKTASAWSAYLNAAGLARRDGQKDRENAASARAKELEPKLARVTFDVAPATRALAQLEVREDGVLINSAAWADQPVDPGAHTLVVGAPAKKTFSTSFTVSDAGKKQTVVVPVLEDEPRAAPAPAPAPEPSATVKPRPLAPTPREPPSSGEGSALRTTGFVIAGLGAAALATGGVFGVLALQKVHDVNKKCPTSPCADADAVNGDHTAGTFADVSTVTMIGGGVAVLAGVIFVLAAPKRADDAPKNGATAHPVLLFGPGSGSVGVGGTF